MISVKASDVRRDFSMFLDAAMKQPQYTKRRRQMYITIPCELLEKIFPQKISVEIRKDSDGKYFSENDILPDIIGYGSTKEEAISSFKEDLIAYAYEYNHNYSLYSIAPNRAGHLTIVMKVIALFEHDGDISKIIEVK